MKVLFSAVSGTDPISNYRDGSMLHICRHYKPDKVYLYLSKEILEEHNKDNRYVKAIKKLWEDDGWKCKIVLLKDEDMENVHIFDAFINKFEKRISKIMQEDKPEELYVNVSSGTPPMKTALQMISMLWGNVTAVQVTTPNNRMNKIIREYDFDAEWKNNKDNTDELTNRCTESKASLLLDRIRKDSIRNYIDAYDYESAKLLADTLSKAPDVQFSKALNMAIQRIKINTDYILANMTNFNLDGWFPVIEENKIKEVEYLLVMQSKLKRKLYVDFIRDITPIFLSLAIRALKKETNIELDQICHEYKKSICISLDKLEEMNISKSDYWTDKTNISANIILSILEQKCRNGNETIKIMKDIRTVESKVRNFAAHEIIGLNEDEIKNKTGFTPNTIMNKLFKLAKIVDLGINDDNRNIYDVMNAELKDMLRKN